MEGNSRGYQMVKRGKKRKVVLPPHLIFALETIHVIYIFTLSNVCDVIENLLPASENSVRHRIISGRFMRMPPRIMRGLDMMDMCSLGYVTTRKVRVRFYFMTNLVSNNH